MSEKVCRWCNSSSKKLILVKCNNSNVLTAYKKVFWVCEECFKEWGNVYMLERI